MIDKPHVLITGASTGLGHALALEFASKGRNLLLVALPGTKLAEFSRHLSSKFKVHVDYLEIDLTRPNSPGAVADWALSKYPVDTLVNNAGMGGSHIFEKARPAYIDQIIQLNIRALVLLSRYFIPALRKHDKSSILNISSISGMSPVPYKTVYPASKAFVYSFSRGLRAELRNTPVRVAVVSPGPIITNPDAIQRIKKQGFLGKINSLTAKKTAKIALKGLDRGKPVIYPGIMCKLNFLLIKLLPIALRLPILTAVIRREFSQSINKNPGSI